MRLVVTRTPFVALVASLTMVDDINAWRFQGLWTNPHNSHGKTKPVQPNHRPKYTFIRVCVRVCMYVCVCVCVCVRVVCVCVCGGGGCGGILVKILIEMLGPGKNGTQKEG